MKILIHLRSKCNNSSDKQENESEVKPEVKVIYDNEEITTNLILIKYWIKIHMMGSF